jgi:hypothetical protein
VANQYNPFNSDFFIYADAGSFRERVYPNWPNLNFIEDIRAVLKDRILLSQISNPINFNAGAHFIQGGFFAGSKVAAKNWAENFYAVHDERFDRGLFVGQEEPLFNIVAFERAKNSIVILRSYENQCIHVWWFFQIYFAQDEIYENSCPVERLSLLLF